jgi:uncharacterized protein (DUF1800 family)
MRDFKPAMVAVTRFGFGAGPGEINAIAADPRGWLKHQLIAPYTAPSGTPSSVNLAAFFKAQQQKATDPVGSQAFMKQMRDNFVKDAAQRTIAAAASATPFRERLVQFWSNHFTVSIQRSFEVPVAIGFENEAIRPHALGSFKDLLSAAAMHPAMLLYLDNAESVGPDSKTGLRSGKGLNENLAREMLELHTLGVNGGYSQTDVTAFANILTGWSVAKDGEPNPGGFLYRPDNHEPGSKRLLGRVYGEAGIDEGMAALADLAASPQTATHIATKLACHFVADQPPQSAIDKLAVTFRNTGGDLHAVALALVDLPQIWSQPLTKIKTPNDLVTSVYRTFGVNDVNFENVTGGLKMMGQMPFDALSPAGWPDTAADWISSEAIMIRLQWAVAAGQKLGGAADPRTAALGSIGPLASARTMAQIGNAPSPGEALAFLIASPEFQRR